MMRVGHWSSVRETQEGGRGIVPATRLLVIGIDAASPTLLRQWVAEGQLPAIGTLIEQGTSGIVNSAEGFFIGSTWPSFATGLNPAGHGFHYLVQLKPGSYEFYRPLDHPGAVAGTPFWKLASDAGCRVAVLDVPLSRLDPDLNGIQTVEWGGHDAVFGFQASSPQVSTTIASVAGSYPLPSNCDGTRRTAADFELFVDGLERAIVQRTRLTNHFLNQGQWDLFIQVFTESHCVGHQCWHLHDPAHPAHDPAVRDAIGDPLARVYRAIDRAVGAITEQVGDATILLVSAHGMGPWRGAQFLLPEILARLGVSVPLPATPPPPPSGWGRLINPVRRVWKSLPQPLRETLGPLRTRFGPNDRTDRMPRLGVDPRRSRCFVVPNGLPIGGIRLNLVGREPWGVLQPGPEAEVFCERLIGDLMAIIDDRTDHPLIRAVHWTDDLHTGRYRDALPDLLVEWSGEVSTGSTALAGGRGATVRAHSDRVGTVEGRNEFGRSGEHLREGWFVAAGRGIAPGRLEVPVSVMDFHPTICRLLGVSGSQVDGRIIPEVAGNSPTES